MPKHTPINYSVMRQTLAEVKPGTCYRHRDGFSDGVDRLRVTKDGGVELVYPDGSTGKRISGWWPATCERNVAEGIWVRCADEPLGGTR